MLLFLLCFYLFLTFLFLFPENAYSWPTTAQWIPVYKNGSYLQDANNDASGSRNIVSDATHCAAFVFNDGQYLHFASVSMKAPLEQEGRGT